METALGRGYSVNDESGLTDFYSPPSSIVDEDEEQDDDLFYPEEVELVDELTFPSSSLSVNETNETNLKSGFNSLPLKLMSVEATPPPTPLVPRRFFDPINTTTTALQNLIINPNVLATPSKASDLMNSNWSMTTSKTTSNSLFPPAAVAVDHAPKTPTKTTSLLTPTSMDRYLHEHRPLADSIYQSSITLGTTSNRHQTISVQHTEVTNETSRLFSYMTPVDGLPPPPPISNNNWSTFGDKQPSRLDNPSYPSSQFNLKSPQRVNPFFPNPTSLPYQSQDPWFLSEMSTILRQNTNISLSATAQQILASNTANNNRPLRSEKIDIEVIKHLIQEADWKRQCGMKKEVCVFCRNNGENELIYSSHSLKDSMGNVTCPILRAYQCPICGATGSQAHTIKYCQATGDDNNRHVPTPYEKMLRMQTFGYDDNMTPSISAFFGHLDSPSSLYTNGWSDSYL